MNDKERIELYHKLIWLNDRLTAEELHAFSSKLAISAVRISKAAADIKPTPQKPFGDFTQVLCLAETVKAVFEHERDEIERVYNLLRNADAKPSVEPSGASDEIANAT